jgi:hypothetical protein
MRLHSKSNLLLTLQKKKFRTDIPEGELLLALMIYSKVVIQYFFTPLFITCFARDNPRFQTFITRYSTREGANKRGNTSRLTQSFHFFMFEPIFSPVNALNQPI